MPTGYIFYFDFTTNAYYTNAKVLYHNIFAPSELRCGFRDTRSHRPPSNTSLDEAKKCYTLACCRRRRRNGFRVDTMLNLVANRYEHIIQMHFCTTKADTFISNIAAIKNVSRIIILL